MTKQRIEWIDTAKGMCIILVVAYHTLIHTHADFLISNTNIDGFLSTFRMPLYFTLSGLFFKKYSSFFDFLIKKCNKLIIPFIFFYIFGSIIIPILFQLLHFNLYATLPLKDLLSDCLFNHCRSINGPLWFLPCLFMSNLLYYFINTISKKTSWIICIALLFGITGLYLSYIKYELPLCISTSFTAIPYFCFGNIIYKYGLLNKRLLSTNYTILISLIIFSILYIYSGETVFSENKYSKPHNLYILSITGVSCILLLSQKIGKAEVISYLGRYSIIVLCTHLFFVRLFYHIFIGYNFRVSILFTICMILTFTTCIIIIPLLKKYLPWFVAQKDLI